NIVYVFLILIGLGIVYLNRTFVQDTSVFYGFAENKETEINLDHDVLIERVHVTDGQFVSKGTLLLEVSEPAVGLKLNDVGTDLEALTLKNRTRKLEIEHKIKALEAEKRAKTGETEARIEAAKKEHEFNKSLVKDLPSLSAEMQNGQASPLDIQIEKWRRTLALELEPIEVELRRLRAELSEVTAALEVERKRLQFEQDYYQREAEKQFIVAPADGLIGNVRCKEGEHISKFNTLISFYQRNPTIVKGYVHESLIVHVRVGDTVEVSSSLHPNLTEPGIITGLGFRIVEIPERLRKRPDFKTYGREVLIQIPSRNPFLQKEKVILRLLRTEGLPPKPLLPYLNEQHSATGPAKGAVQIHQ
ncbi:MAG: hypothetical protein D6714_07560, partial [Bacteroidetes bacterium]